MKGSSWEKRVSILLTALMILTVFASCGKPAASNGSSASAGDKTAAGSTAKPSPTRAKTTNGLTSVEAQTLAWPEAKKVFGGDAVLWRMIPSVKSDPIASTLSGDWKNDDKADAWFLWYADPAGENWFMISIQGKSIAKKDIGTRGSVLAMDAAWPREKTTFSMKQAAANAAAQGANLDAVTWVEFNMNYALSEVRRKPMWIFQASDTLSSGEALNYTMLVDAMTGVVAGAFNEFNDAMALPIDKAALSKPKTTSHEADLRSFFSMISKGDQITAIRMLSYNMAPNDTMLQMWLANLQSIKSLEVVSVEQAKLEQWTSEREYYKVTLKITTSDPPEKYGWENGTNIRWVTLIPQGGGGWKIEELSQNP